MLPNALDSEGNSENLIQEEARDPARHDAEEAKREAQEAVESAAQRAIQNGVLARMGDLELVIRLLNSDSIDIEARTLALSYAISYRSQLMLDLIGGHINEKDQIDLLSQKAPPAILQDVDV